MSLLEAIIIAIVEGLTEFLPISSTGHMIITSTLLGIEQDEYTKVFTVSIQLGAILAVVLLYRKKFFPLNRWAFYTKLLIGVLPALLLGFLLGDAIDALLESPATVAFSFVIGGIILLFVDKLFKEPNVDHEEEITPKKGFLIGCWQLLALVPGVSRSASTIIGGMQQKLTRHLAAEFSFFLAVPTMVAATGYSLFLRKWESGRRGYEVITASQENITAFAVGNAVAFAVAMLAIRFFISYLSRYGFRVFGVYRILAGLLLLLLLYTGQLR